MTKSTRTKFTRIKVTDKKLLSPDDARDLFSKTYEYIQTWDKQSKSIRRCYYDLICGDAFIGLKYKSEMVLFKELCSLSVLHRSTLYDYKNAALMEVELGLERGRVGVNALLVLKSKTTEESRKGIWERVEHICYFDEKNPTPTKPIIVEAKKHHHCHSPEGKAEREAYLNEPYDAEPSDDGVTYSGPYSDVLDDGLGCLPNLFGESRQMTAERALRRIKKYSFKQLEMLSKHIFPTSKVGKDAYRILHESTNDELDKIKAELQVLYEISYKFDYSDEEVARLNGECCAYCEIIDRHDYSDEEVAIFNAEYREYCEIKPTITHVN